MLGRGATAPQSFEEFLRREIKLNDVMFGGGLGSEGR